MVSSAVPVNSAPLKWSRWIIFREGNFIIFSLAYLLSSWFLLCPARTPLPLTTCATPIVVCCFEWSLISPVSEFISRGLSLKSHCVVLPSYACSMSRLPLSIKSRLLLLLPCLTHHYWSWQFHLGTIIVMITVLGVTYSFDCSSTKVCLSILLMRDVTKFHKEGGEPSKDSWYGVVLEQLLSKAGWWIKHDSQVSETKGLRIHLAPWFPVDTARCCTGSFPDAVWWKKMWEIENAVV